MLITHILVVILLNLRCSQLARQPLQDMSQPAGLAASSRHVAASWLGSIFKTCCSQLARQPLQDMLQPAGKEPASRHVADKLARQPPQDMLLPAG